MRTVAVRLSHPLSDLDVDRFASIVTVLLLDLSDTGLFMYLVHQIIICILVRHSLRIVLVNRRPSGEERVNT